MSLFENKENIKNKKSLVIYFSHTGENYMVAGIRNMNAYEVIYMVFPI